VESDRAPKWRPREYELREQKQGRRSERRLSETPQQRHSAEDARIRRSQSISETDSVQAASRWNGRRRLEGAEEHDVGKEDRDAWRLPGIPHTPSESRWLQGGQRPGPEARGDIPAFHFGRDSWGNGLRPMDAMGDCDRLQERGGGEEGYRDSQGLLWNTTPRVHNRRAKRGLLGRRSPVESTLQPMTAYELEIEVVARAARGMGRRQRCIKHGRCACDHDECKALQLRSPSKLAQQDVLPQLSLSSVVGGNPGAVFDKWKDPGP